MPPMTALDALTPEDWAYRTLLRRQAATAGPQVAPEMAQQAPYGAPQPQPAQAMPGAAPQQAPSPVAPRTTLPTVAPPQTAASPQAAAPSVGLPATSRTRTVLDPNDPVVAGGTTQSTQTTQSPYGTTPRTDMGSGRGGGYNYTGFDFDQDANNRLIGKSAKYTFADATREAEAAGAGDVWKTREGAQYFAEKYIKPKLEASGVEVLDIKGDKMFLRDWQDRAEGKPGRWVDFVVNADGDNPALAWQVDNSIDAAAAMERKYASREDAGTNPYATTSPDPTTPPVEDPNAPDRGDEGDEYGKRALLARARSNRMMSALG